MRPLLHIGYYKTGTTWLQRHVFPNAGANLSLVAGSKALRSAFVKVNPFDFEPEIVRKDFEPRIREAQARNHVAVLSSERLAGNPHSGGYDSKIIADRLVAVFPNARVLIVIREQRGMLVSMYKQYLKRGGAATFEQYVHQPKGPPRVPLFRFDFLEYHRLIGYYQGLFGAENVLVLPYELLQTQPRTFLERIGGFAGVPATRAELSRVHPSPSSLVLSLKRHANRWIVRNSLNPAAPFAFSGSNKILEHICREVDAWLPAALRGGHERRWYRIAEREAGARYTESNALTAKLTGIDLRAFGYTCK